MVFFFILITPPTNEINGDFTGIIRQAVGRSSSEVLCLKLLTQFSSNRLLYSLVVECWHRVREVPGSIHSQGLRHTKDVIKMVPVVPLFGTQH